MTDAARRLRQRNQPGLASDSTTSGGNPAEDATDDSASSQRRPAVRYYEPLPLGGDAFMPPLAPAPEPQSVDRRRLAVYCIVGGALGIALGGAALAFLHSRSSERDRPVRVVDTPAPAVAPALAAHAEVEPVAEAKPAPAPAPPVAAALMEPTPAPAAAPPAAQESESAARTRDSESSSRRSPRRSEPLADKPTRAQVLAAMARVQPAAKACFDGKRGMATADIKVRGRTGRVSSAQVSGQTGAIGSCIARAVRKAEFPRFNDESISIRYPMSF